MTPFLTQIFLLSNNLSATPTNTVIDIVIVCLGDCSIAGLTHSSEVWFIVVRTGSMAAGGQALEWYLHPQARAGETWAFETSKPNPSVTPPPTKPRHLNPSNPIKQFHSLMTKYSNI